MLSAALMLAFRTIDPLRDAEVCIAFARDLYTCSFGSDALFVAEFGADGLLYLDWLAERIEHFAEGHVLACIAERVVGQVNMVPASDPPDSGYVNTFYVVPEARGTRVGDELHEYVLCTFRNRHAKLLRLRVSPANLRAKRFYEKRGWRDLGAVGERPGHLLQLTL
jgi:GNAT superfamily N-acetyltransferase